LLATPFVTWLPDRRARRAFALLLAVLAIIIIPFSVGRAAWLGIAVSLIAMEALCGFPVLGRPARLLDRRPPRAAWILGLAGMGLLLALLVAARAGEIAAALDSRVRLWQQAARLFASDPVTGTGPGTFSWARLMHIPDFTDRVGANAAHNVPMQTLAEGGVVLGAALAFVVAAWAWELRMRSGRLERPQRVAVAVLIGFAAFCLLDDFSFLPAVTILVIVLAAWSLPARVPVKIAATGGLRSLVVPGVLAVALVLTVPTAFSLGMLRISLADARGAAAQGDWDAALVGFRAATRAQPAIALHWMSVGLAEHHLGNRDRAVEAYRAAASANPGDARPWGALAALGDEADKPEYLIDAARRSNDPQYAFRLALALASDGREDDAAEYYAVATIIRPSLYAVVPAAIRPSVRSQLPEATATVGSVEGRDPREAAWNAALAVDAVEPDAPLPWAIARAVDAGDSTTAASALAEAERRHPYSPRTWEAASAVARLTCSEGDRERAEARIELLGRELPSIEHRIAERRPGVYREPDLGDYQPLGAATVPSVPDWPLGLIEVPACG
ncbi:MAG: O-antigen ligase family protein, partial [Chloroflexota bacterium]|nr:O-antigen ligase family protein [Chloroflexota bacterium]